MKKPNKMLLISSIGLLLLTSSYIVDHFVHLPDFSNGFIKGAGLSLMLLALIFQKSKPASKA